MELVELGVSQFNEGTLRTFEALCLNGIGSGVDLQTVEHLELVSIEIGGAVDAADQSVRLAGLQIQIVDVQTLVNINLGIIVAGALMGIKAVVMACFFSIRLEPVAGVEQEIKFTFWV